jgi:glucosamine--fructose-6-phosphate aminotransferase (isomerizing)
MCGIVGIIGRSDVSARLLEGLKRLEYRGYDSAGIATLLDGDIHRRRAQGKINNLEDLLKRKPLLGTVGIGHTRWATHGVPNEMNAHPHATKKAAIVHNGIIENYQDLQKELVPEGCHFETETDSEAVVHLISHRLTLGDDLDSAMIYTLSRLEGAFALGFIFSDYPDILIAARRGSPLAIGYGEGEMYMGSDALALSHLTDKITYLEDGDWAILTPTTLVIRNQNHEVIDRPIHKISLSQDQIGKGHFKHFMHKEIHEQPQVIGDTLTSLINPATRLVTLPFSSEWLKSISHITIIACGSSYYAGMIAKSWIEQLASLPVDVDIASEYRYRSPISRSHSLALFISQSGETADTLAALRYARSQGTKILSIVNVPQSTIARESHAVLHTIAGPEASVASTKCFTAQLTSLACFALALAQTQNRGDPAELARLSTALTEIPAKIVELLAQENSLSDIAHLLIKSKNVLFLGRGTAFPTALEGALKLKEITYIHAEGFAAGEMKHGPIALIDEMVPLIIVAPRDSLFEKTLSNVQEAIARGGKIIFLSDKMGVKRLPHCLASFTMPDCDSFVSPLLYAIALQLIAYHTALQKGTDLDQPRNLAKSVTVE